MAALDDTALGILDDPVDATAGPGIHLSLGVLQIGPHGTSEAYDGQVGEPLRRVLLGYLTADGC